MTWRAPILLLKIALCLVQGIDPPAWQVITPPKGGGTGCGHQLDAWSFFVRPGFGDNKNKVVFEFEGGGCCFDAITCSLPQYKSTVSVPWTLAMLNQSTGLRDSSRTDNPLAGWAWVYIPYCTGDAHTGNRTAGYGLYKFHHVGFQNARYAVDFAASKHFLPNAEATLTTGVSAGSVASYVWAPWIMDQYGPGPQHAHLGDSYVPLFGGRGLAQGIKNWGSKPNYFSVPGLPFDVSKDLSARQMSVYAQHFDSAIFSSYTSNGDAVQTGYYTDEGCVFCNWNADMRTTLPQIHINASNYVYYIGPGVSHGRTDSDAVYSTSSTNVKLVDWVEALVNTSFREGFQLLVDCGPNC